MEKKERILLASYMMHTEWYEYECYLQYCECNDIEPAEDGSDEYWNWVNDEEEVYFDDFFGNLKCSEIENNTYAINYVLGLWDGKHEGMYVKTFETLSDAIKTTFESSRHYDGYMVTFADGEIKVSCLHHDGINVFTIKCVSKHGERAFRNLTKYDVEKWQAGFKKKDYFKKIKGFIY